MITKIVHLYSNVSDIALSHHLRLGVQPDLPHPLHSLLHSPPLPQRPPQHLLLTLRRHPTRRRRPRIQIRRKRIPISYRFNRTLYFGTHAFLFIHFHHKWPRCINDGLRIDTLHRAPKSTADLQQIRGTLDVGGLVLAGSVEEGGIEEDGVALGEREADAVVFEVL